MRGDGSKRQRWDFYLCLNKKRHRCDLPRIDARRLEAAVIDELLERVLTPENLAAQSEQLRAQLDADHPAVLVQREAVQHELGAAEAAVERLVDALEGGIEASAVSARLVRRQAEIEKARLELAALDAKLAGPVALPDAAALQEELRAALKINVGAARPLLGAIIAEIIVDDATAVLRYRLPP